MSLPRGSLAIVTADVGHVIDEAAVAFNVSAEALRGDSRARPLTVYRQVAMAAARRLGHSFPVIGRGFDRDHKTVIYACRKVDADRTLSHRADVLAESITSHPGSLF